MRERKRILTLLLLLALVLSGLGLPALADGKFAYGAATVNAAILNVRSGPGTDRSIVGTVNSGTIVVILEKTNSEWYKINYEGTVGYVMAQYLQYESTEASFTARGTVTADSVRVRKGPGTSYDIVSNCAHGESVDVTGISNGWYKVVTSAGIAGYIRSDLMGVTGGRAVGTSSPATTPENTGSTATPMTQTDGVVTGWGVRFRTGPGMSYDFTATLNKGTKVSVIGTDGDWYQCIYEGKTGYLNTTLVSLDTSTTRPADTPAQSQGTKGTVNGSSVRFRESGSTSARVIASLAKGTVVTVLGSEGGWYRCSYDGKTGYISQNYVTVEGAAPAGSTATTTTTTTTPAATNPDGKPVVVATSLRLRSGPDTTNGVLATLSRGTVVSVNGSSNGWLKVSVDGLTGWVSGEYISLTGDTGVSLGTVKGTSVRFRSGPGTGNKILATMPVNARLCVYGKENDWVKCSYNGQIGYISANYVVLDGTPSTSGGTGSEVVTINHNASLGEQIGQYACQFYKYPYVYGEESPSRGFDCSGLVYYVYHTHYGYAMHRTASTQYRYDGVYVNKSELQAGDLVFFNGDGSGVTHVGIYLGSGQYGTGTFIHASGTGIGVIYSDLNSSYYTRVYYGAKRIV